MSNFDFSVQEERNYSQKLHMGIRLNITVTVKIEGRTIRMEWPRNNNDEMINARCRYGTNCDSVVSQGCFHIYSHLLSFYR